MGDRFPEDGRQTEVALVCKQRTLTFAEVRSALDQLSDRLGGVAGKRALLLLPDGVPSYLLHLLFLDGGGTLVPLSPSATTGQLLAIAERVHPNLLITSTPLLAKHGALPLACSSLVVHDGPGDAKLPEWELRAGAGDPPVVASDVRLILFTSGSTGAPKGVCLGERCLDAAADMNVAILSLARGRRSLVTVPLFDYYGLIQVHSHRRVGAGLILGETSAFVPNLIRRLETAQATDLVGVPFGLRQIFRAALGMAERPAPALQRLRVVTSSSESLSSDVLELIFTACPDVTVYDIYGLTEAGRACRRAIRRGDPPALSIGRPSPGVIIAAGQAPTELAEIVIEGPNVMLGYLSEVTAAGELRYQPCRAVRTGDLGFVSASGEVFLAGRRDHLLNVRGSKIHPSEIESVALETPGISDARARLGTGEEPELCLDVVGDPGDGFADLRRRLRARLPFHLVPTRIERVASLERTELGSKLLRRN